MMNGVGAGTCIICLLCSLSPARPPVLSLHSNGMKRENFKNHNRTQDDHLLVGDKVVKTTKDEQGNVKVRSFLFACMEQCVW